MQPSTLQCRKLGVKSSIPRICGDYRKAVRIDGSERIIEMRVSGAGDIAGVDVVTQTVAGVRTLVVTDGPTIGSAAPDATGTA